MMIMGNNVHLVLHVHSRAQVITVTVQRVFMDIIHVQTHTCTCTHVYVYCILCHKYVVWHAVSHASNRCVEMINKHTQQTNKQPQ